MGSSTSTSAPQAPRVCSRHSDREMLLTCRRCGRPFCAECLHQTHAGLHCHECAEVIRSSRPAVSKPTTWLAVLVGIVIVAVGVVVGAGITGLIDLGALDEWLPGRVQTLIGSAEPTPAAAPTPMPASTESQRVPTPIPAPTAPVESQESSARAAYNRGYNHLLAGNYDSAIQAFTEAIRLNPRYPNDAAAYYNRGKAYAGKGQYDQAIQDYDQAITLNPNDTDAYNSRGIAYANKGEYGRSIQDFDQAIRLDPNDSTAYNNRGLAYADKGEYDHAVQDYDQALRLDPNHALTYSNRGLAYARKSEHDRAIQDYDQAIRLDPNDAFTHLVRGNAYARKGENARARSDFNKALELGYDRATVEAALAQLNESSQPTATPRPDTRDRAPNDAAAYTNRGLTYADNGQYDRAIQDYNQAIMFDPDFAAAYMGRGIAYAVKGEYDRARNDFNKALSLGFDRDIVEAALAELAQDYLQSAFEHLDNDELDRAIAAFSQAIDLDPNYAASYNGRGLAYMVKGQYSPALQDLTEAIRLEPSHADTYYLRGHAYAHEGQYDRARSDFNTALELGYDRAPAKAALAELPVSPQSAATPRPATRDRYPDDAIAYINRGIDHLDEGNYDSAIQAFTEAIRINPNSADAYMGRGFAQALKGEYDRARSDFNKALALGYDRAAIEAVLSRLPD